MSIDTKVTFKGNPVNLLRIWTLEESRFEDYEYDGNSGRIKLTENGTERLYQYYTNKENGNTARVKYDDKWWYTYDANGNRTARGYNENPDSGEVSIDKTKEYWTYTWDLWNRLIEVRQFNAPDNAENVHVEYTYDVFNHRIERVSKTKAADEKTQYAYGRNGAITYQKKISGSSVTSRIFVYLNNQIAGFMDTENGTETIRYAVTDIQGSVTEVYDEDNILVWKAGYTAFGLKACETTNLIDFDGLYTGCDYDIETGLTYHWNRWQNEEGVSWLSEDPARDGLNWYGYAGQNPINYTDQNGLTTLDDFAYQQTTGLDKFKAQPQITTNDNWWEYIPSLFSFKNGLKNGFFSLVSTFIDNQIDKALKKEVNENYEGSLYFQQYVSETTRYQEVDVLLGVGSAIPSSEISIASTVLGFLHNFAKRDGKNVSNNITGFIKGAQQEINRIDDILKNSDDIQFNDFLYEQKDKLDKELIYNQNYFLNNYSYSTFNTGSRVNINKMKLIDEATPLPSIDYSNPIYWN